MMNPRLGWMFVWLLASAFSAQAQLEWGELRRLDRSDHAVSVLPDTDSTFLFRTDFAGDGPLCRLERYHTNAIQAPMWTRDILRPEGLPSNASFIDFYPLAGRWIACFESTQRKDGYHALFGATLNADGRWLGGAQELVRKEFERYSARSFRITPSQDSTLLVAHLPGPFGKEDQAEHTLAVITPLLEELWSRDLALPYSDDQLTVRDVLLDREGNAHLYAADYRPKTQRDEQRAAEERKNHTLFSYYWKDNVLKELEIDLQTQWITDARLNYTPSGNLGIAGLYSNGPYYRVRGVFGLILHPLTRRIESQGLAPFDREFIGLFSDRRRNDVGREIPYLYLDHALFPTDTTWTVAAEQFQVVERVSMDPATGRQIITYAYYYEDILMAGGGAGSTLQWATRIPKSQSISVDTEWYSSYALLEREDGVSLLFNDHPENVSTQPQEVRTLTSLRRVAIRRVDVDNQGFPLRSTVEVTDADGPNFRPEMFLQPSPDRAVLFGQFKRTYKLGLLQF